MVRPLKALAVHRITHAGLLLAMALSLPYPALAWGVEGHEAIGWIAAKFLMPDVATKVEALLAHEEESSLASAATWADRIKHTPEGLGTDKWHYVDIAVDVTQHDRTRDCTVDRKPDNCVVEQIKIWSEKLRSGSEEERAIALKWIAHLVGDIHQPLHAAEGAYHGAPDAGGNKVPVVYFGEPTTLHALWDSGLVEHMFPGKNAEQIATSIVTEITESDRSKWQAGTPEDWANKSHKFAVEISYGKLPHRDPYVLGSRYTAAASPVIYEQLAKAGTCLAWVLNETLHS